MSKIVKLIEEKKIEKKNENKITVKKVLPKITSIFCTNLIIHNF